MDERPKSFLSKPIGGPILLFLVFLYLSLCTFMAMVQRSLLYYPHVYTPEQVDQRAQKANLERWVDSSSANIGLKRPSPKQPAEGSILIMYGNGSTAVGCEGYANEIQKVAPMDIYILEYPGYEDRPGKPTEKTLFAAARDAFEMLPTNHPVYLVGQSLGTGVASYLAGTYPNRVAGMVLISPFNSTTAVGQHRYPFLPVWLLLVDRFPSDYYLRNYHGKVGITVDGLDTVVPEKFGLRLYNGYDGPKKLWEFPDGGHCEIYNPHTKFWKEAVAFWQNH
jgi:pimeloyl-ACP methyl ester carboxylesterase